MWPATPKRVRYGALIAFLWQEDKYARRFSSQDASFQHSVTMSWEVRGSNTRNSKMRQDIYSYTMCTLR